MRAIFNSAVCILALVLVGAFSPAEARDTFLTGGPGGGNFRDQCGAGQYLTGVAVNFGDGKELLARAAAPFLGIREPQLLPGSHGELPPWNVAELPAPPPFGAGFGPGLGPPPEAAGLPGAFGAGASAGAADFPPPNVSRRRRATGASTVDDADLTNSP